MKLARWQWGVVVLLMIPTAIGGPLMTPAAYVGQLIGAGITATLAVAVCAFTSRKIRNRLESRDSDIQAA